MAGETVRPPRDGDGDGRIEDGTHRERPAPHRPESPPAAAPAARPEVPPGVRLRAPLDFAETRRRIHADVEAAARAIEPVTDGRHTLALSDVAYEGPREYSLEEQEQALLEGRNLGRRLRGTWTLSRNDTGEVLDTRRSTLADVPYIAEDGTFLRGGNRIPLGNQLRLLPGAYARRTHAGELEVHVNPRPGTGPAYHLELEPETGRFLVRFGGMHVPAYTLLKALGAADRELGEAWGELLAVNRRADSPASLGKLYRKVIRKPDPEADPHRQAAELAALFEGAPLDPEVTRRTLGRPVATAGKETLLLGGRKLLAINRGEAEPDDRDHPQFMTMLGPEDLLAERLQKVRAPLRMALWKAARAGSLRPVPPGLYTGVVASAITDSGLGVVTENVNPLMVADQANRVTRMGEGGIGSVSGIPEESREVNTGQLGFMDFLATSESLKAGVDLRLASGVRKGSDGRLYARFLDARTGQPAWRNPMQVADSVLAFPGAGPHQTHVAAIKGGKVRSVPWSEVDLVLPDMESAFSPVTNLVPMKSGIKGQRAVMTQRMITQALPLAGAEAPLVRSGVPGTRDESFEGRYGTLAGAVRSDVHGQVVRADERGVVVRQPDGRTKTFAIAQHRLGNRKTAINQYPAARVGQVVRPGDLLARSNFTDAEGNVALGVNARIAYIPDGWNFEDAVSISEDFAKRLTSEHYYKHDAELDDRTTADRRKFVALFPSRYGRAQLEPIGDDGVIRVGARVHAGDPLILAARQRAVSYNPLHRGRGGSFDDASVTWDHHTEGEVVRVARTKQGVMVAVRTLMPAEVGDKLSGRAADKGVIAKIYPMHEMPRDAQGRPYELLLNPAGIPTRCYDEQTEFLTERGWVFGREVRVDDKFVCYHKWTGNLYVLPQLEPFHVAPYKGRMFRVRTKLLDFCVTPNHRMLARCAYPGAAWQEVTAERIACRDWMVPTAGNPVSGVEAPFVLPQIECRAKDTQSERGEIVIDAGDWAEFLGWYMAEGNVDDKAHISQSWDANPAKCRRISELLDRLPFAWNYNPNNTQFHVTSRRLCAYLRQFGLCDEKFIPDWLFGQPPHIRQRFLDAYWLGDGRVHWEGGKPEHSSAGSCSERLVDDLQRLHVYQGVSACKGHIKVRPGTKPAWRCGRHFRKDRIVQRHQWEVVDYDGMIYCPTVPTGYVVTRRNGKLLIAGNTNPAQLAEAALGKVAAHTGRPYAIRDFGEIPDLTRYAMNELARHGLSDTETVVDPATGRKIRGVFTGVRHVMKLHHTAESKGQARGLGTYTAELQPARGGEEGAMAKRVALADLNALLSHGAYASIRDLAVRGQANPEMWLRFMSGYDLPEPEVSHVYDKYLASLKAAGINPAARGAGRLQLMALTDRDVDALAGGRELENAETVDWREGLRPVPGGLFDPRITGGHGADRWSRITLAEPMPNPAFEEPIRRVLGLTEDRFRAVLAGREQLKHRTGPGAIRAALDEIDVPRALEQARADVASGRRTRRDEAVRRLRYLKAAERLGIHPRDWVLSRVPVLPPLFRPVSQLGNSGIPMVGDANLLYRELFDANELLRQGHGRFEDLSEERLGLYDAFKGLTGLGEPTHPKNRERQVKGILRGVFGSGSSKFGTMQRKLLGSPVDLVGRAVIAPDPNLDMDEIGLPEDRAWESYEPFVVRRMVRRGIPRLRAVRAVKDRAPEARAALEEEMRVRPVQGTRAPTLHRYNVMAFRPRLVPGSVLRLSPMVVVGFGADFDGDQMNYHVPATDEAAREALEKLLPSRNLISPASFAVHQLPKNEFVGGLYAATSAPRSGRRARSFARASDAVRAWHRGELDLGDEVTFVED